MTNETRIESGFATPQQWLYTQVEDLPMRLHLISLLPLLLPATFALAQTPDVVPTYTNADLPRDPHVSVVGTLRVDTAPADLAWVSNLQRVIQRDQRADLPRLRPSQQTGQEDDWRLRGEYLVGVRPPVWWWWGGRPWIPTPEPPHARPAPSGHNVDALPAPREGWVGRPTKHLQSNDSP